MAGTTAPTAGPKRRALLTRRIRLLVAATIAYNVVEAVVAIAAGRAASSSALVGFGLDSLVEVSSAAAVAWQFSAREESVRRARESRALKVIAVAFFALAAYVTVEAVRALSGAHGADPSPVGIVLAALSVAVMPFLSLAQRRAGRELGSVTAVADSRQTLLCAYLSAALLAGLLLNALLGWAWADPAVALLIAALAVKEGREAWRGDACCAPAGIALTARGGAAEEDGCSCPSGCSCRP
ncbi:cation transporter [Nocardiopsis sp. NPDC058631]|uniref:cation transporter n=1 Tax=Nocardiopsis sp. NPDC058631 TaxID=3346566 RepID=UPI003647CB44